MSSYRDSVDRKEMKDAVMNRLTIGRKYKVSSGQSDEKRVTLVKCRLIAFSRNFAVFEHKHGLKETFTYQELWTQLLVGEIKEVQKKCQKKTNKIKKHKKTSVRKN